MKSRVDPTERAVGSLEPKGPIKLTERIVSSAESKGRDYQIFDADVGGFAICVYKSGNRAFKLTYRFAGRQHRYTIGSWPDWSVTAARERAKALRRDIDEGIDPTAERASLRQAPRVSDLISSYIELHVPTLAARNGKDQISMLRKLVEPEWGKRLVTDITETDVANLLTKIAAGRARPSKEKAKRRDHPLQGAKPTPVRANRVGEVLRKMFGLAVKPWKMREDNPASSFYRRQEDEREAFLTNEQIAAVAAALGRAENQRMADIVFLCMLTGARLGEVRMARFADFNLERGIWTKPASTTKQRKMHRIPISEEVVALVRQRRMAEPDGPWLFPSARAEDKPVQDLRRFWHAIREEAGVDVRFHDLRHTFASVLASRGASLPVIGKLLGHSSTATTKRYAHLTEDALRTNVEAVGSLVRPRLRVVGGD